MLTRALKTASRMPARGFFWSKKSEGQEQQKSVSNSASGDIISKNKSEHEKFRAKIDQIRETADIEYKSMPHTGHWDHHSHDYIHSPRDEASAQFATDSYNQLIDNLKFSIKMQEDIYNKIENMDRPYLRGTPGLETNVYPRVKDYASPAGVTTKSWKEIEQEGLEEYSNRHRFINDAPFNPKWVSEMSNMKQWQQEIENRPVNDHFHPDKGYKFDVLTPYEQRHPHVADRMGYPEFLGNDIDRLLRMENEAYHPNFLDQPFVQTPPINPDSTLNFGEGEVLYENPAAGEWSKLTQTFGFGALSFMVFWKPYHQLLASPIPPPNIYEDIPLPYFDNNIYSFDNYMLSLALVPPLAYMVANLVMVFSSYIAPMVSRRAAFRLESAIQR